MLNTDFHFNIDFIVVIDTKPIVVRSETAVCHSQAIVKTIKCFAKKTAIKFE